MQHLICLLANAYISLKIHKINPDIPPLDLQNSKIKMMQDHLPYIFSRTANGIYANKGGNLV
jgi:hypothetical protein